MSNNQSSSSSLGGVGNNNVLINNDVTKFKSSLSQRAMARRSVCFNSSTLSQSLSSMALTNNNNNNNNQQQPQTITTTTTNTTTTTTTTTTITNSPTNKNNTSHIGVSKEEPTSLKFTSSPNKVSLIPTSAPTSINSNNNNNNSNGNNKSSHHPPSKIPERPNIKPGFRKAKESLYIGTNKSNIGHSTSAASTLQSAPLTTTNTDNNTSSPQNTTPSLSSSISTPTPVKEGSISSSNSLSFTSIMNGSLTPNRSTGKSSTLSKSIQLEDIHIKHTASSLGKMKSNNNASSSSTTTTTAVNINNTISERESQRKRSVSITNGTLFVNPNRSKTPVKPPSSSSLETTTTNVTSSPSSSSNNNTKEDVFTRLSKSSSKSRSLSVSQSQHQQQQQSSNSSSFTSKLIPKILRTKATTPTPSTSSSSSTTTKETTVGTGKESLKSKISPIKTISSTTSSTPSTPNNNNSLNNTPTSISLTSSPLNISNNSSPSSTLSNFKCTVMTPSVALKLYMNELTQHEQSEIFNFPQIYFTGCPTNQKTTFNRNLPNNGYDNDQGEYLIVEHDHIAYRFEVVSVLGQGSFCQVVKCYDHKTNQFVALKILRNQKRFYDQAQTEIKILEFLKNNDPNSTANIVHLNDHFEFRNHLCITFELLSMNLYDFLKQNQFQGYNLNLIRRFAAQLLTSLRFLSKRNIIHADLKPENILLKQPTKSGIKLIDFGSSCFENEQIFTYIQSRFYRSPEVIMGMRYDKSIDIWSLGCILAELYMGIPLFAGNDEIEQMACIIEILGLPPNEIIESSTRKDVFYDRGEDGQDIYKPVLNPNTNQLYGIATKTLADVLGCQHEDDGAEFVDFIKQCLEWSPNDRITPDNGLKHPWIIELYNSNI